MPRLVNDELTKLVEQLTTYKENLSLSVYEHYKTALVLSKTINLRGKAGDVLKEYINVSHINLTQKIINVIAEITEVAEKMKREFSNFESASYGIVGSGTLDNVHKQMKRMNDRFTDIDDTAGQLLYKASEFISTTSLGTSDVTTAYTEIFDHIKKTKTGLEETDSSLKADLDHLITRVYELQTHIFELSETFRDKNGIKYSKLNEIPNQEWYTVENNHAFQEMQDDDPFVYHAGHASMAEGQWVAGTSDTNYIAASGYAVGAEGELTKSGTIFSKTNDPFSIDGQGEAALLSGSVQGETLGGYGNLDASGQVLGADGNFHFGSDGFDAEGKVAVIEAEGSAMVGTDNFNGYVSGHAEALTAKGHARFTLPEDQDGDIKIGLGGKAQGATAGVEGGLSLFEVDSPSYSYEDGKGTNKKSMLGIEGGVNIGPQVGAGVDFQSKTVYSNNLLNVRATEIDVDLKLFIGLKASLSVPTIQLKWPW
ncbi:T7SS effector LXG polymorphic toxin [Pseudogracilibacillus sp. SO30301A]|uniref:T7SS effector LXG polymorphic toxin n=1 Tax=Pseudogracilibacillus sp. SO30301A TaxID=3098291 RepID=UPI00300DFEF5